MADTWSSGAAYEPYVGRWSRLVAAEFLKWLAMSRQADWVDVGCGTGALTSVVLASHDPRHIVGIDPSEGFLAFARQQIAEGRAEFEVGDAEHLPVAERSCDVAISGLVLNFVPHPEHAVAEMRRVVRPGGTVAVYVWDYAGEMQFMRYFWNAAMALHPEDGDVDEAARFPLAQPDRLRDLWQASGLRDVVTTAIDVLTVFADFDDYWAPFLGGQGAAPTYLMRLSEESRAALRESLRATLPTAADGSIHLIARAWAVRGGV